MGNKRTKLRQEQRQRNKDNKKYNMTYNEVRQITEKTIEEQQEAIFHMARKIALKEISAIFIHSLSDEFGFKEKRLTRFFRRVAEVFSCIDNPDAELSIEDIIKENEKTNFPFELVYQETLEEAKEYESFNTTRLSNRRRDSKGRFLGVQAPVPVQGTSVVRS